jgi:predicted transcriptional regulator
MNENIDIFITFHPDRPGLEKFLGKLEAEVMEIIWASGPMTVKRALYFLNKTHNYAYTTVMTVMNRLADKSILSRRKEGHSFFYSPALTRQDFLNLAIEKVVSGLMTDFKDIAGRTFSRTRKPRNQKLKSRNK